MKRAKGKLQSAWPIGLTMIAISSEHAGLQPHWKRIETELYKLAARYKENPQVLRDCLVRLRQQIGSL